MKFLIVLTLVSFAAAQQRTVPTLDGRIIGGSNADIANYPYQAALHLLSSYRCGAVIISPTWILTAAHCVENVPIASFLSVRVGSTSYSTGGQVHSGVKLIVHPSYNSTTYDYDIALLQLSSTISTANAQAATLPSPGSGPSANSTAVVTGWGALKEGGSVSPTLQVVQVPVVSQSDCNVAYSPYGSNLITDRMFCAGYLGEGGRDACQGDSGGPLLVNGVLAGLVSWGQGCARPEFPGVYTNVPNLRAWIATNSGL